MTTFQYGSLTTCVNIHPRTRGDARHVPMQDSELWSNWYGMASHYLFGLRDRCG